MLKVIMTDVDEIYEALLNENTIKKSVDGDKFLCTEEVYKILNEKYKLDSQEYTNVWTLQSLLECNWQSATIEIPAYYLYEEKIEIEMDQFIESVLQEVEESELFKSDDWEGYLYKQAKRYILESIKLSFNQQINMLINE